VADTPKARSVDEYIAGFPPTIRGILEELRALIKDSAPGAQESVSYGIPTFDLRGKHLVHFAAFKNHVGLYPTPSGIEAFAEELAPYVGGKGSVRFPLGRPLPGDLIRRIVDFRVKEMSGG